MRIGTHKNPQGLRYALDGRKQGKHTQKTFKNTKTKILSSTRCEICMGWAGRRANTLKKHLKTQIQKSSAAQGVRYAWGGQEEGQTHSKNI